MSNEEIMTTEDVAKYLGITRVGIYKLIKKGLLEASKVGHRTIRVKKESVIAYLDKVRIVHAQEDEE